MSPSAAEQYLQREKRFVDAIRLEATDRVPLEFNFGYFPAKYCGTPYDASYYDYDAWLTACKKTLLDFGADICSVQPFFPGSIMELVEPRVVRWPGGEACTSVLRVTLDHIGMPVEGALNRVIIPLHFGSEGFCSLKQFETFYWPTLKELIVELIERGFTPAVMTEGDYTSRLEYLLEIPKGKAFLHFDNTDMFRAKDVLGGHLCISGNVPVTLLAVGTPDEVRDIAKQLIDYCGRDGGFVMSSRTPVDDARPENLKALIDFTIEYGRYA
jgi:hypothetical protein